MKRRLVIWLPIVLVVLLAGGVFIWDSNTKSSLLDCYEDFREEVEIAGSTSRIGLGSEIRELRDIQDEVGDLSIPPWRKEAYEHLMTGMDYTVTAFLAFQSQSEDYLVQASFEVAEAAFNQFETSI